MDTKTEKKIRQQIAELKALGSLILEKAIELEKSLSPVQERATRKGHKKFIEEEFVRVMAKRRKRLAVTRAGRQL